jgi:hypothetical protein
LPGSKCHWNRVACAWLDGAGKIVREAKAASEPEALVGSSVGWRLGRLGSGWTRDLCRNGCMPAWPQHSAAALPAEQVKLALVPVLGRSPRDQISQKLPVFVNSRPQSHGTGRSFVSAMRKSRGLRIENAAPDLIVTILQRTPDLDDKPLQPRLAFAQRRRSRSSPSRYRRSNGKRTRLPALPLLVAALDQTERGGASRAASSTTRRRDRLASPAAWPRQTDQRTTITGILRP